MIVPYDKNIQWQDLAYSEMSLNTMIDYYYDGKLVEKRKETHHTFYPYPTGKLYRGLYDEHKDLLLGVVETMIGQPVFTPSEINKEGTSEHYLFIAINQIFNIVWFYNIDKTQKGYEKAKKKYDDALITVQRYSATKIPHQFPSHKNEIIKEFEQFFAHIGRVPQGKEVITAIKNHFSIVKATATQQQRITKEIHKIGEQIEKSNSKK